MPTDEPDYFGAITAIAGFPVVKISQLPWWVKYTPRQILYLDDFEGVLKWRQAGGTVTKASVIQAFEGSNCMQITSGAIAGSAELYFGNMPLSQIMLQLRFNINQAVVNNFKDFNISMSLSDGSYNRAAAIRYSRYDGGVTRKWQYLSGVGTFTDLPGGSEIIEAPNGYAVHQFFCLKIDFKAEKYISLETSELNLDLSSLPIVKVASGATPQFGIDIEDRNNGGGGENMFVDALCLSREEGL